MDRFIESIRKEFTHDLGDDYEHLSEGTKRIRRWIKSLLNKRGIYVLGGAESGKKRIEEEGTIFEVFPIKGWVSIRLDSGATKVYVQVSYNSLENTRSNHVFPLDSEAWHEFKG